MTELILDKAVISMDKLPSDLPLLKEVSFSSCKIDDVDALLKYLGTLKNIEKLDIDFMDSAIPKSIGLLNRVKFLSIHVDSMQKIPVELHKLNNLYSLYIESEVYSSNIRFNAFPKLKELGLSCSLKTFPFDVLEAQGVEVLNLSFNPLLEHIPKEIGRLHSLKRIELINTKIPFLAWNNKGQNDSLIVFKELQEIKDNCNQCLVITNIRSFR